MFSFRAANSRMKSAVASSPSGGRRLSERLGFAYYDQEIISEIARRTELSEQYVQSIVEHQPVISFPIHIGTSFYPAPTPVFDQSMSVYQEQVRIIEEMAQKSDCIIVGRCGDYVLREYPGLINVFICADWEDRVKRIAEKYDISERKAADKIKKMDRERQHYYESHTGLEWGSIDSHHMLLNVSRLGMERAVDILEKIYR